MAKQLGAYIQLTLAMISVFSLVLFLPLAIYEGINFDFSTVTTVGWRLFITG
jgi:hypothetical protein